MHTVMNLCFWRGEEFRIFHTVNEQKSPQLFLSIFGDRSLEDQSTHSHNKPMVIKGGQGPETAAHVMDTFFDLSVV